MMISLVRQVSPPVGPRPPEWEERKIWPPGPGGHGFSVRAGACWRNSRDFPNATTKVTKEESAQETSRELRQATDLAWFVRICSPSGEMGSGGRLRGLRLGFVEVGGSADQQVAREQQHDDHGDPPGLGRHVGHHRR